MTSLNGMLYFLQTLIFFLEKKKKTAISNLLGAKLNYIPVQHFFFGALRSILWLVFFSFHLFMWRTSHACLNLKHGIGCRFHGCREGSG